MSRKSDAEKTLSSVNVSINMIFIFLTLGSVVSIFSLSGQILSNLFDSNIFVSVLSSAVCVAMFFAIDYRLPSSLRHMAEKWLRGQINYNWQQWVALTLLSIMVVVRIFVTGAWSWLASEDLAKVDLSKIESSALEVQRGMSDDKKQVIKEFDEAILDFKNSEAKRVRAAINSQGKEMARLYNEGNAWARKQLRVTIQKEKDKLISAKEAKLGYLKNGSIDKSIAALIGAEAKQIEKKLENQDLKASFLRYFSGAMVFLLMIFCGYSAFATFDAKK